MFGGFGLEFAWCLVGFVLWVWWLLLFVDLVTLGVWFEVLGLCRFLVCL